MSADRDPPISELETEAQEASYDRWFRAKVEASLADTRPGIPHEEMMARMDSIIEAARRRKAG
jgi:hypothetical protein